jgi:hypothetical protein
MRNIKEIKADLAMALEEVPSNPGLNMSDRVQMAIALLHEYGKYNRGEAMSNGKTNGNGEVPATEKQKSALFKFGIKFSEDITKAEASAMLDKAIADSNGRKGR